MNREIQNDAYGNATNVQDAAGNEWRYEYGFDSALVGEERIDAAAIHAFRYYGIEEIDVVK